MIQLEKQFVQKKPLIRRRLQIKYCNDKLYIKMRENEMDKTHISLDTNSNMRKGQTKHTVVIRNL